MCVCVCACVCGCGVGVGVFYMFPQSFTFSFQIGDFGLSRDLVDEEFYLSRGGQIPMKWTSIEVLYIRRNLHTTCTICMSVFPQKRGRGVLRPPITLDSNTFNFNVVH